MTASDEHSHSERIQDLIEESDRVRREGERLRNHADRAMKHRIWPERRQGPRPPSGEEPRREHYRGA
jgi:hypothetical protein